MKRHRWQEMRLTRGVYWADLGDGYEAKWSRNVYTRLMYDSRYVMEAKGHQVGVMAMKWAQAQKTIHMQNMALSKARTV